MNRFFLLYKDSRISYLRFGTGPKPVLCLHGYGEEAGSFAFLDKYAGNQFTFYAFDMPFHGQTEWNEGLNFTIDDLCKIVSGIRSETNHRLSLFGFSLGGRMALCLYQVMTEQIDKLILLAPDGMKVNFWYWLATQTWMGNKLFALTMKRPAWFFGFLKLLNGLGLVNASIFKFVNYYIGNKEVRELLYARWTALRKLNPELSTIKLLVAKNNTPVRLVYGRHDRIILPVHGEKFRLGIEGHCTISIIHSGHQVLHEKHAKEILPALLD